MGSDKQVTVDFLELDDMRLEIIKWAEANNWRKRFPRQYSTHSKSHWDQSTFYIGRNRSQFAFHMLRCDLMEVQELAKYFRTRYDYRIAVDSFNRALRVYLRG